MSEVAPSHCPHCQAARVAGPECPRCGVLYARARPRPLPVAAPQADWDVDTEDAQWERRLRWAVLPASLLLAWILVQTFLGQFLLRTFLSMWIHELGHAVMAWLCGFNAFPGPWRTAIADERSPFLIAVIFAGAVWLVRQGRRLRNWRWTLAGVALAFAQLICALVLRPKSAQALITFGGDTGCLVLGPLLMGTFYVREESPLRTRGLRWGFVAIGAAAFVDSFHTWWAARGDTDLIPYGEIEGVGLSDPAKLVETYGWTLGQVVGRYVGLGCCAAVALTVVYSVALWRTRRSPVSRSN